MTILTKSRERLLYSMFSVFEVSSATALENIMLQTCRRLPIWQYVGSVLIYEYKFYGGRGDGKPHGYKICWISANFVFIPSSSFNLALCYVSSSPRRPAFLLFIFTARTRYILDYRQLVTTHHRRLLATPQHGKVTWALDDTPENCMAAYCDWDPLIINFSHAQAWGEVNNFLSFHCTAI
jgi:hypothetical protein